MTKNESGMQPIVLRDLISILRLLKHQGNPDSPKVGVNSRVSFFKSYYKELAESRSSLKISIPKDASKPDGDAVEDGALLSASELHARGHFVHSPSDVEPIKARRKEKDNDKSYQPPKRSNALDDEAPECIYTSGGEEVTTETEYGRELVSVKKMRMTTSKF